MTFVVGPGVLDAMKAAGDEPRSDEEYGGALPDGGAAYSLTQGRDAIYRWTPSEGTKRLPFADAPRPAARVFGVWNGVDLNGSLGDIFGRVHALVPPGDWGVEWFPKAGEGGSWQRDLGDPHGLGGEADLRNMAALGNAAGIRVVPYVVIRGRYAWDESEWAQIAACAAVCGKVILNLEPGSQYWNGVTSPNAIHAYCHGMELALLARGALDATISLCAIPRREQVDELGGDAALSAWLDHVEMASWECYEDSPAPALAPGYAIPTVVRPLTSDPLKQIPTVQRSMIGRYAASEWAAHGMEVWHLDGN